ncbi:membrane protease YdiL (CAAX protease family) [Bacillus ectoiniformans]|uniref:CPBP family intramembrane glutamic endopeptidase n=1 Tax=Bacillus ectoiniformans TaxID=1494429 RepID=UPI00195CC625|nr:type II CAAX endopeptidase family protein [Bacillus ectoiniformans]MBM7650512.1 membrane protease YdiL (CAAX protease family) [Bacillus ectoiniformans]
MKKEYGYILIAYILMQLSGFVGYPLVFKAGQFLGMDAVKMKELVPGYWLVISFSLTLLIVWLILRKTNRTSKLERMEPLPVGQSVFWAVIGVFLALFAQRIAIAIEAALGIEMGSQNTESIIQIIELVPAVMIAASVIGPILEEIVFRKILFGSLYEKYSFTVSALISSVIFSLAHMELEHTILYASMGFTFAFLYVKTKRIIVPICAHVAMNSLVVVVQYFYADEIEKMMKEAEQMQQMILWFM